MYKNKKMSNRGGEPVLVAMPAGVTDRVRADKMGFSAQCCPDCDQPTIVRQGHCAVCVECGWSACSR